MFEVISAKDVDITPKEAVAMREMGTRPAAEGGMKLGLLPCAEITVGLHLAVWDNDDRWLWNDIIRASAKYPQVVGSKRCS